MTTLSRPAPTTHPTAAPRRPAHPLPIDGAPRSAAIPSRPPQVLSRVDTTTLPEMEERPMDTAEVFQVGPRSIDSIGATVNPNVPEPPSRFTPIDLLTPGGVLHDPGAPAAPVLSTARAQGRARTTHYAASKDDSVLILAGLTVVGSMLVLFVMLFTGYGAA